MMAAAILAGAPVLLAFACEGYTDRGGARRFEIHFREVRSDGRDDIELDDLSLSKWEGDSSFVREYFAGQAINGRMTRTGAIEIFSDAAARDKSAQAWLRLDQVGDTNQFNFEAKYSAFALGHFFLSEDLSGACFRSVSRNQKL